MQERSFYILDVFAEEKYAGNQLAVLMAGQKMSDAEMQKIAKEFNYSETTFILSDTPEDEGYNICIFTPEKEIPFAGHPTLGTAYVIQKEIIKEPVDTVFLNLKAGRIPVKLVYKGKEADQLVMRQPEPVFGKTLDKNEVAKAISLDRSEIDGRFPVEEVSTGMWFIIVPLKTLNSIKRAKTDRDRYFKLIENTGAKAIVLFSPETYRKENHLNVRVFAGYYGIPEDPATGSGCGCLAAYLVKHRYFGKDSINVRIEQGYEIKRPSLLFLEAEGKTIYVGGKVIEIAKGNLL
jgi:trans-2,3-dihydro-3-hydroxyanthranilate isomerase